MRQVFQSLPVISETGPDVDLYFTTGDTDGLGSMKAVPESGRPMSATTIYSKHHPPETAF